MPVSAKMPQLQMNTTESRPSQSERASAVTLREAQYNDQDLAKIWPVCRLAFAKYQSLSLDQFLHYCRCLWFQSPARTSEHPFGWVMENADGIVVGFFGLVPAIVKLGDREVVAGAGHSWAVHPAYRCYGLRLMQKVLEWGRQRLVLITGANEETASILRNVSSGFRKIPIDSFNRHFWWLIRPGVVVRWALTQRGYESMPRIVEMPIVRGLFTGAMRAYFAKHRTFWFDCPVLPVELVSSCGEEFDELWHRLKHTYGILGVRDRATLNWRHFQIPSIIGRTVIFACREGGALQGYLALQERYGVAGDPPGLFAVTDVFYDRRRPNVLRNLFNAALDFAVSKGCAVFQVSNMSQDLAEHLESQGPYVRPLRGWNYWYRMLLEDMAQVCRAQEWWPSASDGESNI